MIKNKCILCGSEGTHLYNNLKDYSFGVEGQWSLIKCPNPGCGLSWLDSFPSKEDLSRLYKEYYTHTSLKQPSRMSGFYDLIRQQYLAVKYCPHKIRQPIFTKISGMLLYLHPGLRIMADSNALYLQVSPGAALLDVGCGDGYTLNCLSRLGWNAEGIDIDQFAVENARKRGLKVQCATLDLVNYPENHFDAITMRHFIEHVPDPLAVLRRAYRLLKPGGQIAITTPNLNSWGHKIFKNTWRGLEPPRHLYIFTQESFRRFVEESGFTKVRAFTTINGAYGIFKASFSGNKTIFTSITAGLMEIAEWIILKINRDLGEEIVLIADKP